MNLKLVRPTLENKDSAIAFRNEFFDYGEKVINGSEMLDYTDTYEKWLRLVETNTNSKTVNPDWVVTDTFFAVDEAGKIVGIIDFRHELKGFLVNFGHTGYSVRFSERKKGYATQMLSLIMQVAKEAGLDHLQLSVERTNEPSVKTIIKNGGVYVRSFEYEGETADVYHISLA